ncbi:MORN repeat containing protein [Tunisvirus fontaine2]|uniref:MORN repeat containing protein n=1 Tax=Tunisvirus fontaine2 TaxID=1421067 RepID=V9SHD0_9VIRU|nr:MORN repeat containing protein [Tunisvirus fontaine2]AHC55172.1 MORN repeat containing protein [Tunisvirus fontaine2]
MFVFLKKRETLALCIATKTLVEPETFRLHVKRGMEKYHLLPDGTRDGEHKEYWQTGKIKSKSFYSFGKLCGTKYEWSEEGVLLNLTEFLRDEKHGICKTWDEKGQILSEQIFERGKLVGEKTWYADGTKQSIGLEFWHSNGTKRFENGKTWDVDGTLLGEYSNGSGKTFSWYPNTDKISSWTEWKDGQKHGLSVFLREDGTFLCIEKYFEGKLLNKNYYRKR